MIVTVGLLEFTSISAGYLAEDAMLKAGAVELILARTICPGKYLVIVSGDVDAVKAALEAGKQAARGLLADELLIPHIHPDIFPALAGTVDLSPDDRDAIGIVESFSASSAVRGADAACKTAGVILFRLHIAMAVGGKGYFCMTGDVGSIRAAVDAAIEQIACDGLLVGTAIIPRPRDELFQDLI